MDVSGCSTSHHSLCQIHYIKLNTRWSSYLHVVYGGHFVYVYDENIRKSNLGEMVRKMTLVLDGSRLTSTHLAQVASPLS